MTVASTAPLTRLTVSRRLAAVAFADVAGYSQLIGEDDVDTTTRWNALRKNVMIPRIAEHHGRLIRVVGDCLFCEFPSAVDAVRWALEVQRAIGQTDVVEGQGRLEVRIGINVEDVIVDDDDDLHGDGVNIAARIQQLAAPGQIVVTSTVRDYIWNKLSIAMIDLGEQHLKNISHPVRMFRVEETSEARSARRALTPLIAWTNRPSVAVLPFRNSSGDPAESYFGEGITEDIISALCRNRSLLVIARNSTLRYRDDARDTREIATELGVRYVLEGSVRRQATRLRITTNLIDATQTRTIWAEHFDGANDALFEFQDRIASSIVAMIEPHLLQAESERVRSKPTDSLDAYDCVLRALPLLHRYDAKGWDTASSYIDRAIALDPNYAQAYAYRAWLHLLSISEHHSTDFAGEAAAAKMRAQEAIALDSNDAFVLAISAHVFALLHKQLEVAAQMFDRSLQLNENSVFAWGMSGITYCYLGRSDEAMERIEKAFRLSPFDPYNYFFLAAAGLAEFVAGRYENAIAWLRKALRAQPRFLPAHRHFAASLALSGQEDEAKAAGQALLALDPHFSVKSLGTWYPLQPRENLERYLAGLSKAGLPD